MTERELIGRLRHRVIIEQRTRTADGAGGGTIIWSTYATVWAMIEPMSAKEIMWAKHLEHRVSHKVYIRHLNGVTSDMRVSFDSRTFQINGIRTILEKNRFIELTLQEGSAS